MKAVLEFNLPEDRDAFILATNAGKYYNALIDLKNKIREFWKYGDSNEKTTFGGTMLEIFNDCTDNINFDDIS